MSAVTLVELRPRRPADGTEVVIRLVHNARSRANFLGQQWLPLVASLPVLESQLGFNGKQFGAGATPVVGEMEIVLDTAVQSWASLIWRGASIVIRHAPLGRGGIDPADGDFTDFTSGRCDNASVSEGVLKIAMIDVGDVLRRPVSNRVFGTSGVAVLDAAPAVAQKGNVVPMGWGRLESVPAILIDAADQIYLLVGQAATSISAFYDGGYALGLGVARANLAALRANAPAAGQVDYCLDAGGLTLARPWTKPVYPFTADLIVGDCRPAAVASAIVTSRTALTFKAGVVAAYHAAQSADIGIYIAGQETIAESLDRIFAGLGSWWKLTSAGVIDIRQLGFAGAPLRSFGSWERGIINRAKLVMPTGRRTLGYKPNWRQHGENEIAKALLLTASDVTYADGTAIEALKPADAGATAGDNLVANADLTNDASGWTLSGGAARIAGPAGSPATAVFNFPAAGATAVSVLSKRFRVDQNERIFPTIKTRRAGAVSATYFLGFVNWFDASDAGIGNTNWSILPSASGVWETFSPDLTAPAGTVYGRLAVQSIGTSGADVLVSGFRVAKSAAGADVTAIQPIVSQLDPSTGQLETRRALPAFFGSGAQQLYSTNPLTATTSGSVSTITINAHVVLDDAGSLSFSASSIGGLAPSTLYYVYEDNPNYVGGARTYLATTDRTVLAAPGRRYVASVTTPASSGGSSSGGGASGGGWGGGGGGGAIP